VLSILLAFDVLGPPPERGDDFIQFTLDMFAWEKERWVLDFVASALFAIGFLALAGLGSATRPSKFWNHEATPAPFASPG
jgi:hypothetical protein